MKNTKVSECANPECKREFKRLGEGKLFVRQPSATDGQAAGTQKALWLCDSCIKNFDLRYDRRQQEFHLVRRRRVA